MLPEAKSLRWLVNAFPLTIPAKEESDKLCNAIHLYAQAGADKLEQQAEKIASWVHDFEEMRKFANLCADEAMQLKEKVAALTDALRQNVSPDDLCHLCQYEESCATEALDEDGQITRYWRCRAGEQFEIKE